MIRVLHIYPQMKSAGTEMVIMNLYRNIDREQIQFDFCVQKKGETDETILAMGGKVHYIPYSKNYEQDMMAFFKSHPEYKIVHTHTHTEMGIVLRAAKKAGVPCRIAHSHNSRPDLPKIMKLYKMWTSRHIEASATHFLACSQEAAEWLYPLKHKKATVWNNAIDLDAFKFNEKTRREYRELLGIPNDAKVIAHVGRFAEQKNHTQMIEWLNSIMQKDESVYALLVGGGPLFERIKAKAQSERISFLGLRKDVPGILCASDVFLFPSLYEGLGIVAVEAQASGLQCIASMGVPAAADIGIGLFERHSLASSEAGWLERIYAAFSAFDLTERKVLSEKAFETEYNIKQVAAQAQKFYLDQV